MKYYDVAIVGGGFAGLTLAYQLINNDPNIKICIIDQKSFPRAQVAHTIGESLNEIGGIYVSEILSLRDYMMDSHFHKKGMRFFFENDDGYCEMGINSTPLNASFHFMRGKFENDLHDRLLPSVEFFQNEKYIGSELENGNFVVETTDIDGRSNKISARWLVDASGMKKTLAREKKITRKLLLNHSSVWFRVKADLNVNDIYPKKDVDGHPFDPDIRDKASVHLEGAGYWVWLLRLSGGCTSVGITFNEDTYDFNELNTLEKVLSWLEPHEPSFCRYLKDIEPEFLDFKTLRKFSSQADVMVSDRRWALIGDAYGFWDPYYSNGFDLIALQNTLLTRIIMNEKHGISNEGIIDFSNAIVAKMFDLMRIMFTDFYDRKGNWLYVVYKYIIDSILYFGFPCVVMIGIDFKDDKMNSELLHVLTKAIDVYKDMRTLIDQACIENAGTDAERYINLSGTLFTDVNMIMQSVAGDSIAAMRLLGKNLLLLDRVKEELKASVLPKALLQTGAFNAVHYES